MANVERSTTLEAVPASAGGARRFVAEALVQWRLGELVETAELLVSELVTNALLHAHTSVKLAVRATGPAVRIEVCDTSPALPSAQRHHEEAQTGRGLELVEQLAHSWGVDVHHESGMVTGKSVWFQLSAPGSTADPGVGGTQWSSRDDGVRMVVCLEAIPTALYRADQEHRQGLTREFVLMTLDDGSGEGAPSRLVALSEQLRARFAAESATTLGQLEAAEGRGDATLDLMLDLPPEAAEPLHDLVELLEEADRFCQQGAMLTVPAGAEITAFRRWCLDEVVRQLAGAPSTPWSGTCQAF